MTAPPRQCDSGSRRGVAGASVSLPILADSNGGGAAGAAGTMRVRRSTMTWKRFAVLFAVQVIMIIHLLQWLWSGRTISPVEPSESMQLTKAGIINTGAILFGAALLSTAIVGRFFCGWGCHILLIQDGCAWILRKLGVRPKPFRSRLLLYLPLGLALYMFVWPIVYRLAIEPWSGVTTPWPGFSAQFITSDFWRTFPGPLIAAPFLLVCGALAVYFLGQKGFCTYGCPYGGFFAPIDRISPARIRVTDACEHCGHCTAVCTSNVRIHEEVAQYGMVVDPGCMKCMDCVTVCPNDALYFGFGPIALNKTPKPGAVIGPPGHRHAIPAHRPDLSWGEEVAVSVVALVTLLAVNAPFASEGAIKVTLPLLFSAGVAICVSWAFHKGWRIVRDRGASLHRAALKREGRVTLLGVVWILGTLAALAAVGVLGTQNVFLALAEREDRLVTIPADAVFDPEPPTAPPEMLDAAARADSWYRLASTVGAGGIGFVPAAQPLIDIRRAWLAAVRHDLAGCEFFLLRAWRERGPRAEIGADIAIGMARALRAQARIEDMNGWLDARLVEHPEWTRLQRERVMLRITEGDNQGAIKAAREWLAASPNDLEAMRQLSLVLIERGADEEIDEGIALVHKTLEIEPNNGAAWRAIAWGHARRQRLPEAEVALREAIRLRPEEWRLWQALGDFLSSTGRPDEAAAPLAEAARLKALPRRRRSASARGGGRGQFLRSPLRRRRASHLARLRPQPRQRHLGRLFQLRRQAPGGS